MSNPGSARQIKSARLRLGLSQDELAEKCKLSLRTIQRIENGETEGRGDSLKKIAKELNIPIEELTENGMSLQPAKGVQLGEGPGILLLLHFSAFGFLIFPLLGVLFPAIIWFLCKTEISGVDEIGKKVIRSQISWCILIMIFIIYLFILKTFQLGLLLLMNHNLILISLYIYNSIVILINVVKHVATKSSFLRS